MRFLPLACRRLTKPLSYLLGMSASVVPGTHRWRGAAPDGSDLEGPVRRPLWTSRSTGGVWSGPFRTVEGWEELEERAVTPTFEAGDVRLLD